MCEQWIVIKFSQNLESSGDSKWKAWEILLSKMSDLLKVILRLFYMLAFVLIAVDY